MRRPLKQKLRYPFRAPFRTGNDVIFFKITTVGDLLFHLRSRKRITLEGMSLRTGIDKSNLSAIESGRRRIGVKTAKKLGVALDCNYLDFL